MGFLLAAAAYSTGMRLTGNTDLARAAYLICLVFPAFWSSSAIPDSALYAGAATAWFLCLLGVRSHSIGRDLLAMVAAACANLIRNDAILLVCPLLAVLYLRLRVEKSAGRRPATGYPVLMIVLFGVAMSGALILNRLVAGSAMSSATGQVLFLNNLGEFSNYYPPTLHTWLSIGVKGLVKLRVEMLAMIIYRTAFILIGFSSIFLAGCIGWKRGESKGEPLAPYLVMLGVGFAVYGLVLPAIGQHSMMRTVMGLLPFLSAMIVVGISRISRNAAAAAALIWLIFSFYLISGVMMLGHITTDSAEEARELYYVARAVRMAGMNGPVMTDNPAQLAAMTGLAAIQMPGDGEKAARAAISTFHVHYVLANNVEAAKYFEQHLGARPLAVVPDSSLVLLTLDRAKNK